MLSTSHKAMVVAATGAGKTSVAVKYLEDHNLQGLVICPKVSICQQWDSVSDNVATMTYQKFCNEPDVSAYDCYIFDEAHHTGASKWGEAVKNLMANTDKPIIGLTADPKRYLDGGRDVGQELWDGNIIYGLDLNQAIEKKVLPGGTFVCALFDAGAEMEKYRNIPVSKTLKGRLDTCTENCLSIHGILHKHMPEGKRKGIVFVDSIERVQEGVALIQATYPLEPIWYIHSERPQRENVEALLAFNKAERGFVVTVDMLNEGVHVPDVNTIIMLRRTSSPNIFMQQLGRGFTPSSKDVAIFDFVGNNCNLKIIAEHIRCANGGKSSPDDAAVKLSSQFIVYDYASPIVEVIRDIKKFLDGMWTKEEDNILRNYYPTEGLNVSKRLPNRTKSACKTRVRLLGIHVIDKSWKREEDDILAQYYPVEGTAVSKRLPGRSNSACKARASILGIRRKNDSWAEEEDNIIRQYYNTEGSEVVKRLQGRTKMACNARARQLGIRFGTGPWTEQEDNVLRAYYPVEGTAVCKRLPGRTKNACRRRAHDCGIPAPDNSWTPEEDLLLKTYYPTKGKNTFKQIPTKTESACIYRVSQLGLHVNPNTWTPEEDEILKKYYPIEGLNAEKRLCNKNEEACKSRVRKLGIRSGRYWTPEEDEIIKKYYPEEGVDVVNRLPGRTYRACKSRAKTLKVKSPLSWTEEEDKVIREYYPSEGSNVAGRLPGRTRSACQARARTFKIRIGALRWSKTEDDIMRTYYPTEGRKVSKRLQNRNEDSCMTRAHKLGIKRANRTPTTPSQLSQ